MKALLHRFARLLAACPLLLPQHQARCRTAAVRLAAELDGER